MLPPENQKCSGCPHHFGEHYLTVDGKKRGCAHYDDFQRDGGPCPCKGFAMLWQPSESAASVQPAAGDGGREEGDDAENVS